MRSLALTLSASLLAACTAAGNPERSSLTPVPPRAEPAPAPAVQAPAAGAAAAVAATPPAAQQPPPAQSAPQAPPKDAAPAAAQSDAATALLLGRVGDRVIDSRAYLRKLWVADNRLARRVIEQLVFAELATLEGDRLGVRLIEQAVDAAVARATAELEKKLADKGSKLTLREHIEQVIGIEPELYLADLRDETIVQMLAERCVRAYMLESERCDVRLTEVRSKEALAAFQAEQAAGKSFAELAVTHGMGDDAPTHTTRMRLARNENQELSRLVFATPVGTIGGPLEQSGRWLFFVPDQRLPGREGTWVELREEVEKSLVSEPVGDMEFLQWRSAMVRRYRVELGPFFDLVERQAAGGR